MDFKLFTDAQLTAGLNRYKEEFQGHADAGRLAAASCTHGMIERIHAEMGRRCAETYLAGA